MLVALVFISVLNWFKSYKGWRGIYIAAVNEALETSECFSEDKQSYKYWLQRVWKNEGELSNVPDSLKTAEICLVAIADVKTLLLIFPMH